MKFLEHLNVIDGAHDPSPTQVNRLVLSLATLTRWMGANANDLGPASAALNQLIEAVRQKIGRRDALIDLGPFADRDILTRGENAEQRFLACICDALSSTCWMDGVEASAHDHSALRMRAMFHSLAGVVLGLTSRGRGGAADHFNHNPYPFIAFHNLAPSHTTDFGFTLKFQNDHLSANADSERRARLDAHRRLGAPNARVNRSSTIDSDETDRLRDEIRSRKDEFTRTYDGLTQWYIRAATHRPNPNIGRNHRTPETRIDGITFISRNAYHLHEFARANGAIGGSERASHIHFSVSPTRDGRDWAVHHYANAGREIPAGRKSVAAMGVASADRFTYCTMPFSS